MWLMGILFFLDLKDHDITFPLTVFDASSQVWGDVAEEASFNG